MLLHFGGPTGAGPGPFTLYVMTGTNHSPWQVPAGAPTPLGNTPLGTFRHVDDTIRAFVERLRARQTDFDHTLLVIIADHTGPTFGTQPLERLRLPLILAGPPIARARARWSALTDRPASEVDVLPTIASLLDGDRTYAGMGRSQGELLAVDGDATPPVDLAREHPEVASRLTREFPALYETADRLMRENRVFPIDSAAARSPRAP